MLTIQSLNPDKRLSVTIAIFFAEDVLPFWEAEFSEDMRPRAAIEAAKAWLINPCEKTADAAYDAAVSVSSIISASAAAYAAASSSAYAAADAASSSAGAAVSSASYAVSVASSGAYNAAVASHSSDHYTAHAASNASNAAAYDAVGTLCDEGFYIHSKLVQLLPHILEYKIYTKTSFKDSEQVLNLLSKQNQERFLFNLNHLR